MMHVTRLIHVGLLIRSEKRKCNYNISFCVCFFLKAIMHPQISGLGSIATSA